MSYNTVIDYANNAAMINEVTNRIVAGVELNPLLQRSVLQHLSLALSAENIEKF